jgi:hypothetical protein
MDPPDALPPPGPVPFPCRQLLTTKSNTYVLDCHGDRVFQWDSGSALQTFINHYQIRAEYLIRKNGTLIAYVDR